MLGFAGSDTIGNIIYWIGMFFAPFSLLDCFQKIAFQYFEAPEEGEKVYGAFGQG
jgi:hypothetical protein